MNAMDYPPIRLMFWFGIGGAAFVLVCTTAMWLLLREDRISEEEEAAATARAPLLPTIPEETESDA